MKIDCQFLGCTECCRRYWISVLPEEALKIAALLEKTGPSFLRENCLLQAQLYPSPVSGQNELFVPLSGIPKEFHSKLKRELGELPPSFLVLPTIVFKRKKNGACGFLDKNGLCSIHPVRPKQCELFPFIPWKKRPLAELYPFCAFLQEQKKPVQFRDSTKRQYQKTASYFDSVEKNGFSKVWKTVPSTGILRLDNQLLGTITKKQFFSLLRRH